MEKFYHLRLKKGRKIYLYKGKCHYDNFLYFLLNYSVERGRSQIMSASQRGGVANIC